MIPALLSCVFVIYLYQSLRDPEPESTQTTDLSANANARGLSARMESWQSRLDALSETRDQS